MREKKGPTSTFAPPLLPSYLLGLVKVGVAAKSLDHLRVAVLGGHVGWGGAVLKG